MPPDELQHAYGGTITFHSNLSLEQKDRLMQLLTIKLSQHLRHSVNSRYEIVLVKEYHKVDGQDDHEAPHYHFILYTHFKLAYHRAKAIENMLKDNYGRSQFYLMTKLKRQSYERYINKDIEKNKEILGYEHIWRFEIGPLIDRPRREHDRAYLIYDSDELLGEYD